jgi:hypothetical protein
MTPDEAKEYDARRAEIMKLVETLAALEKVSNIQTSPLEITGHAEDFLMKSSACLHE